MYMWCMNFLPYIRSVATKPCKSLRHKSNTFDAILALCTYLCRSDLRKLISIKQTKHTRKSWVLNIMFKMSTIHTNTCTQTTTPLRNRCRDDGIVQQPPLPQQTFFQLLHIMDPQTVDPLLKDTPDAIVHSIQIRRTGWPQLWGMNSGVCLCSNVAVSRHDHVHHVISLTSTLRHKARDELTCSKFTSIISIHL